MEAVTPTTRDIVAKLWSLCHVLRDDGVGYNEYVTEITYLLFLKMLAETGGEGRLPAQYRWAGLAGREGLDQLDHYMRLLLDLGNPKIETDHLVLAIFTDAQTRLTRPTNLKALTSAIDKLDWFSAREEGLGNLYEGLLEKNAAEAPALTDTSAPPSGRMRLAPLVRETMPIVLGPGIHIEDHRSGARNGERVACKDLLDLLVSPHPRDDPADALNVHLGHHGHLASMDRRDSRSATCMSREIASS